MLCGILFSGMMKMDTEKSRNTIFSPEKQYFDKRMSVLWQKSLPQCLFWYYNFEVGYFIPKKEKEVF